MASWREILIITGGMTPQVVSETVFALARRTPDPLLPQRIICVVTHGVAARFCNELPDVLRRMAEEWEFSFRCDPVEVEYPVYAPDEPTANLRSKPVEDIRSDRDAVLFGNLVAEIVRSATQDSGTRVHLSLAGGRKTMSFHGGAALGLFGRPQDELSHVLVHPPELEQCPDFWFPARQPLWLERRSRDGAALPPVDAGAARVELSLVPFVRVRTRLPQVLRDRPLDYDQQVNEANAELGRVPLRLELVTNERLVIVGELTRFDLPNQSFAFYQVLAEWMRDQVPGAGPGGVGPGEHGWMISRMFTHPDEFDRNAVSRFIEIYGETFRTGVTLAEDVKYKIEPYPVRDTHRNSNEKYFRVVKSDLLDIIRNQFTQPFLAERFGAWRDTVRGKGTAQRFGLKLEPSEILIRDW